MRDPEGARPTDPPSAAPYTVFAWRVRDALAGPQFEALKPRTRLFAVLLATCADTYGGNIWRNVETFAEMTGYSVRSVKAMFAELEAAGRLETQRTRRPTEPGHVIGAIRRVVLSDREVQPTARLNESRSAESGNREVQNPVIPASSKETSKEKSAAARNPERLTCGECGNTWPAKFGTECYRCRKATTADPTVTRRHREQMGPTYERLHTAGIEAAETAVWSDCGDCGSTVLADMTRCPTCGSTTINARPVVGLAREDAMQTNQKPAPAPRLPAVPAVPAAVPAPPIVDPPFDPREAFTPQPKPTPVMPPDPEYADVLAAYQCIREAPLTDLERSALAELPPADTLSWLAQADGAEGLRGAA